MSNEAIAISLFATLMYALGFLGGWQLKKAIMNYQSIKDITKHERNFSWNDSP